MGWHYGNWSVLDGSLMGIAMIVFWVALVAVVVLLVRRLSPQPPVREAPPDAQEILDRRFASGEIDEVEYRARTAAIRQARDVPA